MEVRKLSSRLWAVSIVSMVAWPGSGNSQEPHRDIPPNAHYTAGAQGWSCNSDFTQVAGLCMRDTDVMPSASAFEIFDGQWRCRPGYHRADKFCVPGVAPEHAAFVANGDHWECDWGFQKTGSQCQEIKPPQHGYIEAAGHDWACYPGFARASDRCVPMTKPAPAAAVATPSDAPTPSH
jgi:hypothetical protein